MKERIQALVGPLPFRLWVGTFHSIGVRVLRGSASAAGVDALEVESDFEGDIHLKYIGIAGVNPNGGSGHCLGAREWSC